MIYLESYNIFKIFLFMKHFSNHIILSFRAYIKEIESVSAYTKLLTMTINKNVGILYWNDLVQELVDQSYDNNGHQHMDRACIFNLEDGEIHTSSQHPNVWLIHLAGLSII